MNEFLNFNGKIRKIIQRNDSIFFSSCEPKVRRPAGDCGDGNPIRGDKAPAARWPPR